MTHLAKYTKSRNAFGPIAHQTDVVDVLEAYFSTPTVETWTVACNLIIGSDGAMTLWQAVCIVDASFQCEKKYGASWERVPGTFTARRAMKHAQNLA